MESSSFQGQCFRRMTHIPCSYILFIHLLRHSPSGHGRPSATHVAKFYTMLSSLSRCFQAFRRALSPEQLLVNNTGRSCGRLYWVYGGEETFLCDVYVFRETYTERICHHPEPELKLFDIFIAKLSWRFPTVLDLSWKYI